MPGLAALLLVLGLLVLAWALAARRRSGLPWAYVAYDDAGRRALERPLRSTQFGLVGKPDYLLERRGVLIPVEVKPTRQAREPYYADVMQLVAYCLLVEESTGRAPGYGLLRYAETTFQITYDDRLRDELLDVLDAMHDDLEAADCDRDHDDPRRCRGCGFYELCDQALR